MRVGADDDNVYGSEVHAQVARGPWRRRERPHNRVIPKHSEFFVLPIYIQVLRMEPLATPDTPWREVRSQWKLFSVLKGRFHPLSPHTTAVGLVTPDVANATLNFQARGKITAYIIAPNANFLVREIQAAKANY